MKWTIKLNERGKKIMDGSEGGERERERVR